MALIPRNEPSAEELANRKAAKPKPTPKKAAPKKED